MALRAAAPRAGRALIRCYLSQMTAALRGSQGDPVGREVAQQIAGTFDYLAAGRGPWRTSAQRR